MGETTGCPECGQQAQVHWRAVLESTDGPVEHCKIRCVHGHCFLLPVATLAAAADRRVRTSVARPARTCPPAS